MISEQRALEVIQETIDGLYRVGLIGQPISASGDTVLLGSGSVFNSTAFVTFVFDLEEMLCRENGEPMYLIFEDLHQFNQDQSCLSAATLARYIASS